MNILDIAIAKQLAGGGGSGTDNYNELSNLPKINGTTLSGDKSSSSLGLQSEIKEGAELASDLVDDSESDNKFVTSAEKLEWSGKQDLIDNSHKLSSDLVNDADKTNKFVTASEKETWNGKQNLIDNSHKLSSDLVDDANKTNKFVTSTEKNTWNAKQNAIDADHKLSSSLVSFSEAEAAALASGINSTKVGQISTNQTNILYGIKMGVKNAAMITGFEYVAGTDGGNYTIPCAPLTGDILINCGGIVSTDTDDSTCLFLLYFTDGTTSSQQLSRGFDIEKNVNLGTKVLSKIVVYPASNYSNSRNDTITVVNLMICSKSIYDQDSSYASGASSNIQLTSSIRAMSNVGAKNLVSHIDLATTLTGQATGITLTPNDDGSITLNGTSSSSSAVIYARCDIKGTVKSNTKYVVYGTNSSNVHIQLIAYDSSGNMTTLANEIGIATVNSGAYARYEARLWIKAKPASGTQFSNLKIYPLICEESLFNTNPALTPYALPNYDLTQLESEDRAALAEEIDAGAKNILDFANLQFQTQAGTTHTKTDTDITVASTGTSTWAACTYKMSLSAGNYVFSAKISNLSIGSGGVAKICLDTQADGHGTRAATLAVEQNGTVSKPFTWSGGTLYIMYYPNYSGNLVVTTFKASENMICTKAAFGVSQKFVPHRPNYQDLIKATAIEVLTSSDIFTPNTNYTVINDGAIYKQGKHIFGNLIVSKSDGNFTTAETTIGQIKTGYRPVKLYIGNGTTYNTSQWGVNGIGYCYIPASVASSPNVVVKTSTDDANKYSVVIIRIDYCTP